MGHAASIVDCLLSIMEGDPWILSNIIDVILRFGHMLIKLFLERPGVSRRFEANIVCWISWECLCLNLTSV